MLEIENAFVIYAIILFQLCITLIMFKVFKSIAYPAVMFEVYWTFQIILGIAEFKDSIHSYYGIFWIVIGLAFFCIGGIIASGKRNKKIERINDEFKYSMEKRTALTILIVSILIGCIVAVEIIYRQGFSISQLLNFDSLVALNNITAYERYNEVQSVSVITKLCLPFVYFAPLIGGFNLVYFEEKWMKIICWTSVMPAFLVVLVQNTKAGWIGAIFIFASGYITARIKKYKTLPKITVKAMSLIASGIAVFLGINYGAMLMRIGKFDIQAINVINTKFALYMAGHIPAFDIWFSNRNINESYTIGVQMFYGIANTFGISQRAQGVYTDFVQLSVGGTNVYSIFRPIIMDFGSYIGLLIMLLFGYFSHSVYERVRSGFNFCLSSAGLAGVYFTCFFCFTSPWAYMSYTTAYVLFAIYLRYILTFELKMR